MTYSSEVLADTPVTYYRLGDTSGTTATDDAGNAHHLTYSGAYTLGQTGLQVSDSNGAVLFSGGRADAGGFASWMDTAGGDMTIEALINPSTVSGTRTIAARYVAGQSFSNAAWSLRMDGNTLAFYVFTGSFSAISSSITLSAGNTYHVAVTYNGTTDDVTMYINGVSRGTGTVAMNTSSAPLVIGCNSNLSAEDFSGVIDEVAFYSTCLTSTRVNAHYTAATTTPPPPAPSDPYGLEVMADTPVQYLRLADTSGTTALDLSGNVRNGVYVNTPTLGEPAGVSGTTASVRFTRSSSERVDLATAGIPTGNNPYTLEVWCKPASIDNSQGLFQVGTGGTNFQSNAIRLDTAPGYYNYWWGSDALAASGLMTANNWHHIVATHDGSTRTLYLDGVQIASASVSGHDNVVTSPTLGKANGTEYFDGWIQDAAIYDYALSSGRVTAHYNTGTGVVVPTGTVSGTLPSLTASLSGTATPPAVTGTSTGTFPALTASLTGTATPPAITGTADGTLPAPSGTLSATVGAPSALVGTIPSPTASLAGTVVSPVTGTLVGTLPELDGSFADTAIITLTGTSGSFTLAMPYSGPIEYTPSTDGSLVIQVNTPVDWLAVYTITDTDGDEIQDSDDPLGLVWVADEPMTIHIAADPDEPDPVGSITFDWSYAARASSVLTVALDYNYMQETPGGLAANISDGQPGETVTFSIIGTTTIADFQTAVLDDYGTLDVMIQVPGLAAGDYYLRTEGTDSGSEDVEFTTLADALSYADSEEKALDTAPERTPTQHWRFFDLRDHDVTWTFPRNPRSWTNIFPPNDFTHDNTTAPDGQSLTWQAAARPWRMEFTGWLDTEEECNQLVFWSQLRRRFWLIDHRNRAWLLTIEQFDAVHQIKPNLPWAHEYTVKTLVFMQG